jgi:hypothetical protein
MLEGLLALAIFGSFTWFCILTGLLICIFFWSENVEHGEIAFAGLVAFLIINYYWGNLPISNYISWINALIYFGIGFLYAILKCYVYGTKSNDAKWDKDHLKGNVFRWWFLWPISLINWIFSDLLKDFYNLLYRVFKNTFEFFFTLGVNNKK